MGCDIEITHVIVECGMGHTEQLRDLICAISSRVMESCSFAGMSNLSYEGGKVIVICCQNSVKHTLTKERILVE